LGSVDDGKEKDVNDANNASAAADAARGIGVYLVDIVTGDVRGAGTPVRGFFSFLKLQVFFVFFPDLALPRPPP